MKKIVIASTLSTTLLISLTIVYFGYKKALSLNPSRAALEKPPPEKNDHLVLSIPGNPQHLDPILDPDQANERILPFIFDSLVSMDAETRGPIPCLASSWTSIDEGLIFEFKIRENILFHDQKVLTVADIKATFDRILDPSSPAHHLRALVHNISTITTPDANTIRFKFKDRHFQNLISVGLIPIPSTLSTDQRPIGTGPYLFKSWDARNDIQLVLNPRYWGMKVEPWRRRYNFNVIRFLIIPDEKSEFETFKNGGLDVMEPSANLHWELFDDREFNKNFHHLRYEKVEGGGYSAIGWNLSKKLFQSTEIRIALTQALDRREINEKEFRGQRRLAAGPFSILNPKTDRHMVPIKFNLEAAKQKISELGWAPDPRNGTLLKDGQHFEFEIIYAEGNSTALKVLKQYQDALQRLGIQMTPKALRGDEFVDRLTKRDFDAFLASWNTSIEDDPYSIWHSSQMPPNGNNFIGYSNSRADKILNDARYERNLDKQNLLYWELQNILRDEAPYIFLYEREFYALVQKRFEKSIPPGPYGLDIPVWFTLPGKEKYKD